MKGEIRWLIIALLINWTLSGYFHLYSGCMELIHNKLVNIALVTKLNSELMDGAKMLLVLVGLSVTLSLSAFKPPKESKEKEIELFKKRVKFLSLLMVAATLWLVFSIPLPEESLNKLLSTLAFLGMCPSIILVALNPYISKSSGGMVIYIICGLFSLIVFVLPSLLGLPTGEKSELYLSILKITTFFIYLFIGFFLLDLKMKE